MKYTVIPCASSGIGYETGFAKRSLGADEFQYEGVIPKFHTVKEMAGFMLELYDSDKIIGIVNGETYEFQLRDPIFPHVTRIRK